jgi:pimeloyl-ACP methyl ester carboxylesterase
LTLTADESLPRLVLFAGLGADHRLFHRQNAALRASVEVPAWIHPLPRERINDYAARIAPTIRSRPPYFLGGVSFGGMVAMEVAQHVSCQGVILISSCRSCRAIPLWQRFIARPLARAVPAHVQKWVDLHVPGALRPLGKCTPADRSLVLHMIRDTPAAFLRWSLREALRWRGVNDLPVPIHHIHGRRDRTIPCPRDGVDQFIPDGGHLIALTHADAVNAFIDARIKRAR